jgi:hypothetical protein
MTAAAATTEFGSTDSDHLDPSLAEQRVRVGVAVIRHHDAGLQGDDVIAVVPLLPLGLPRIAAGFDDVQRIGSTRSLRPRAGGIVGANLERPSVPVG